MTNYAVTGSHAVYASAGSIPIIEIQFDSPSEGSIFDLDRRGRSTVKPQKKLQALSGYHDSSE